MELSRFYHSSFRARVQPTLRIALANPNFPQEDFWPGKDFPLVRNA